MKRSKNARKMQTVAKVISQIEKFEVKILKVKARQRELILPKDCTDS